MTINYKEQLPKLDIVNKDGVLVPFSPNEEQIKFLDTMTNKSTILKARQIGFSTLILGMFTLDFLMKPNSRSVAISHEAKAAQRLLDRVKFSIDQLTSKGVKVDLKYSNRGELVNNEMNSSFFIGQAGSSSFGRGDTINNLHLSEFAFYQDPEKFLAGALQAVVPDGKTIIESSPNGRNFFARFWDKSKNGETGFSTHFYDRSFYDAAFLKAKEMELSEDDFMAEYPQDDVTCFIASGRPFFPPASLLEYRNHLQPVIEEYGGHYDLRI